MSAFPYDIAIFGGGPVGTALALWTAATTARPERLLVLDRQSEAQARTDPRVIALSAGSLQLLARVAPMDELAAAPITRIHVSQIGHLGRTLLDARDDDVPAYGVVVRYGELMRVLGTALARSGVQVRRPVAVQTCAASPDGVRWTLATDADGATTPADAATNAEAPQAAIAVHAEGGLFQRAGAAPAALVRRDYGQSAVISEIDADRRHGGIAYERFGAHGPVALLPLPEPMRYALVWCERPERAEQIAALGEADFLAQLQTAFGHRAGRFLRATPAHAYALGLVRQPDDEARVVRIGNAAQALHPVTGQGLNLGLRDAYGLAQAIARHGATPEAITHMRAARRTDRWATVRITDSLARGFALPFPPLRHAAGLGLLALDLAPALRSALARQMMFGVRD